MTQELLKITTSDNIELVGILYKPIEETKKVVIHVHGLAGNFYENSFVDFQAKSYTNNGYAYFPFNNRGNGYFTELISKGETSINYPMGGSAFEVFEDSYLDIDAAIKYVKKLGYNEIVLQGHSFGCGKVAYYYSKSKDEQIKKIILLAPCDMVQNRVDDLKEQYNNYLKKAKEMIKNGIGNQLINYPGFPPFDLSAKTFCSIYIEDSNNDIFRFRKTDYISKTLNDIEIPVLVQIGTNDIHSLSEDKDVIIRYLKNNIKNVSIKFIEGSNHGYYKKEQIMCDNCNEFLNN